MALQELMASLEQQLSEHRQARTELDAAVAALEQVQRQLLERQAAIESGSAREKSEQADVRVALQAIRDEVDRQLAELG